MGKPTQPSASGNASGVDCKGANQADNLLSGVLLGLGVATLFGCVPCRFIGISHMLPLIVVKVVKVICCP
jgi:hypothetical protein